MNLLSLAGMIIFQLSRQNYGMVLLQDGSEENLFRNFQKIRDFLTYRSNCRLKKVDIVSIGHFLLRILRLKRLNRRQRLYLSGFRTCPSLQNDLYAKQDKVNADWQSSEYEEAVKGNKTQQREETTNAALTRGAHDKEQKHTDKGCRYVIVVCHQVRG